MGLDVLIIIFLLILLIIIGLPIGICLIFSGAVGLFLIGGSNAVLGVLQTAPYRGATSYILTTIPMFVLMAEFANISGITKEVFHGARAWLGHHPGGLAIATVFTSAGVGAISGSSSATAAMMGKLAVPEMIKMGYSKKLALGTVSSAGTLAIMIPPSIGLILYGILTQESIGKLLIAGILPGLFIALLYVGVILIWIRKDSNLSPKLEKLSLRERFHSTSKLWPLVIIIFFVLGGIYSGAVTATESAAIGATATLLVAKFFWKINWKNVFQAAADSIQTTSMIFLIIIGANVFGYFLTMSRVIQSIISFIGDADISKWLVLLLVIMFYLILGCFMDQIAILVLTVPLTFPIMESLGFNPIWFGIVITILAEIGLVTPPLGLNVFVASSAAKMPVEVGFAGIWRFVVASMVALLFVVFFPQIATWLPSHIHN